MIWRHGREKFYSFLEDLNSFHPSIKFTSDLSSDSVNFLDVQVSIRNDGVLETDVYDKPTDTMLYLSVDSCHPSHVKRSIAFSLAKRIKAICSTQELSRKRCEELSRALQKRGHSFSKVTREINRALEGEEGTNNRKDVVSQRVPLVIEYHPGLPDIKELYVNTNPYFIFHLL